MGRCRKGIDVACCERVDRCSLPVGFPGTVLLGLGAVSVGVAGLGKVARQVLVFVCSAVGEAVMISVVVLVGTCHWRVKDWSVEYGMRYQQSRQQQQRVQAWRQRDDRQGCTQWGSLLIVCKGQCL